MMRHVMALIATFGLFAMAGCGFAVNGPRFWWDDKTQQKMPADYELPPAPKPAGEVTPKVEKKIIKDQKVTEKHKAEKDRWDKKLADEAAKDAAKKSTVKEEDEAPETKPEAKKDASKEADVPPPPSKTVEIDMEDETPPAKK